jgi:alpha-glucosidase
MRRLFGGRFRAFRHKPHRARGTFQPIGAVQDVELDWQGVLIRAENGSLRLDVIAPDCLCVRFAPDGAFPLPRSYTVHKTDWEAPEFELDESPELLSVKVAGGMSCLISRGDSRFTFLSPHGALIGQDAAPISFRQGEFRLQRALSADARCYGLAAPSPQLDLRGKRYALWQSAPEQDSPAYLPFLMLLSERAVDAIFWDNASRGYVDIGAEHPQQVIFSSSSGELRYYQFSGTPLSILQRYSELIGRAPLPPLWAFGAHCLCPQPTSAETLRAFATECRAQQIPCDAIALGLDYMEAAQPFVWDNQRFPKPSALLADLARRGFKALLPMTFASKDISAEQALKYPDGELVQLAIARDQQRLIDLTDERGRALWSERYGDLLRAGLSGIWQPELPPTLPDSAQYACDGAPTSHVAAHNIYAACAASAAQTALLTTHAAKRAHVLGRVGQGGVQRYAWSGIALSQRDEWRGLRRLLSAVLNNGLSGIPFSGALPNYALSESDPELFVRTIQLCAVLPLCSLPKPAQVSPLWQVGQAQLAIARQYLTLRYQLLPYLYTVAAEAAQQGVPMVRPLWLNELKMLSLRAVDDAFLLGNSLLIAPVLEKGVLERTVLLPAGKWYDFFTAQVYEGGQLVRLAAPLERMPILVRAGHVLPMWIAQQHVGQRQLEELLLRVYIGEAESSFYEDEGDGFAYQQGNYRWLYFACRVAPSGSVTLNWRRAGAYRAAYSRYRFEVYGILDEPESVYLDDSAAPLWYYEKSTVEFTATQPFERARIEMRRRADQQATLLRSPLRGKD